MPPAMKAPQVAARRSASPGSQVLDPAEITRRKEETKQAVQLQLKKDVEFLNNGFKKSQTQLLDRAKEDKRQHETLIDQHVKSMEFALTQHFREQVMRLTQVAQSRRAELENQAFA